MIVSTGAASLESRPGWGPSILDVTVGIGPHLSDDGLGDDAAAHRAEPFPSSSTSASRRM